MRTYHPKEISKRLRRKLNRFRTLVLLLLMPMAVLIGSVAVVRLYNRSIDQGELQRRSDADWYWSWEQIRVDLIPQVDLENVQNPQRAEVVFCIDISSSMGAARRQGDPLQQALQATQFLGNLLLASGSRVGVVSFNNKARPLLELTNDPSSFSRVLAEMEAGGGTDIHAGLQSATSMLTPDTQSPKLIVLISDGLAGDEEAANLIRRHSPQVNFLGEIQAPALAQPQAIFVGIGIGSGSDPDFFVQTFSDPNGGMCCENDPADMSSMVLNHLVDSDLVGVRGRNLVFEDWPHLSALPLVQGAIPLPGGTMPLVLDPGRMPARVWLQWMYWVKAPLTYSYFLEADAWGVHPLAIAPARLSYSDPQSGISQQKQTGRAPLVLVISPGLLLLLFLPATLYALRLSEPLKLQFIADPRDLTPLPLPEPPPQPVPVSRFAEHALIPLGPQDESALIPTLAIGLGPAGGQLLAGLCANRREAGYPEQSPSFLPLYLDCRALQANDMPQAGSQKLASETLTTIGPADGFDALLQDIDAHPEQHIALNAWCDMSAYRGRSIQLNEGCDGDRRLARLAFYGDCHSKDSRLRQALQQADTFCQRHERVQILLLAGAAEDRGSTWLIDMAFLLRQQLRSRAVPLYACLDTRDDLPFSNAPNKTALFQELQVVCGAAGWPLLPFAQSLSIGVNRRVTLPLFDRVMVFEHLDTPATALNTGAALLELCEHDVLHRMSQVLGKTALVRRASSYRDPENFVTRISTATLIAPLEATRHAWRWQCVQALHDSWLGVRKDARGNLEWDRCHPEPTTVWQAICAGPKGEALHFDELPSSAAYWHHIGNGNRPTTTPTLSKSQWQRQLVALICRYLNPSASSEQKQGPKTPHAIQGRFESCYRWLANLVKKHTALGSTTERDTCFQRAADALSETHQMMTAWRNLLAGPSDGNQTSILDKALQETAVIAAESGHDGRAWVPRERWSQDFEALYQKVHQQLVQEGGFQHFFQWIPSADGTSLDWRIQIDPAERITPEDLKHGRWLTVLDQLLFDKLLPQSKFWSLESWVPIEQLQQVAAHVPFQDLGVSFSFSHMEEPKHRLLLQETIQNKLAYVLPSRHQSRDRMSFLGVLENSPAPIPQTRLGPDKLPLVQPCVKIPRELFQAQQNPIMPGQRDLSPRTKLLAQNRQMLCTALAVVALDCLKIRGQGTSFVQIHYEPDGSQGPTPLTQAGNGDMGRALFQLMLHRRDLTDQPLDPSIAVELFNRQPQVQRRALLSAWAEGVHRVREPHDWQILLCWQALYELREGGLLL